MTFTPLYGKNNLHDIIRQHLSQLFSQSSASCDSLTEVEV